MVPTLYTPKCSRLYQGGRSWSSVSTRGSLSGHSAPEAGGRAVPVAVRTTGTQTHTSCLAWHLPGALPLNPLHVLPLKAWPGPPALGRACTPTCPPSPPPSELTAAHLISTIQCWLRATGRTNPEVRFRGERPKETTHVEACQVLPSRGQRGKAQVKGDTREPGPPLTCMDTGDTPQPVFRAKH